VSDTAHIAVEEPLQLDSPQERAYHHWIGAEPYSGSAKERAAFLAGFRAAGRPIPEEAL
jgi:hypothetical protein